MILDIEDRLEEIAADEEGFTTAELIGNAALGVAALAMIWGMIQSSVFPKLIAFMEAKLGI
jgi:cytochrome b